MTQAPIDRLAPARRPDRRAVMYQSWRHLLFLHWELPADEVATLLPPGLDLDTFQGRAYVGIVPFYMTGVRPAYLPSLPWLSHFPETNVRTYVHRQGRDPGVWFASLDAGNPVAAALGRKFFHLPYFHARMALEHDPAAGTVRYASARLRSSAETAITCRPVGPAAPAVPGTLDHFLIERYLLYASHGDRLYMGQVHHSPYLTQTAEVSDMRESVLPALGLRRGPEPPLSLYARGVDVEIFPLGTVTPPAP